MPSKRRLVYATLKTFDRYSQRCLVDVTRKMFRCSLKFILLNWEKDIKNLRLPGVRQMHLLNV